MDDFFFFKILFIYLREKEWEGGGSEGEADSLMSRVPNVGVDPGTPGSWPQPTQAPSMDDFLKAVFYFYLRSNLEARIQDLIQPGSDLLPY